MTYTVLVKPGSKKSPLVVENGHALTVFLREKPIDGAANQALVKVLAKHFSVSKSQVTIKAGTKSRHKLVDIV